MNTMKENSYSRLIIICIGLRRFKLENWFQHLEVGGVGGGWTRKQTKKLSILTVIIFKTGEGLREAGGGCKGTEMSIT